MLTNSKPRLQAVSKLEKLREAINYHLQNTFSSNPARTNYIISRLEDDGCEVVSDVVKRYKDGRIEEILGTTERFKTLRDVLHEYKLLKPKLAKLEPKLAKLALSKPVIELLPTLKSYREKTGLSVVPAIIVTKLTKQYPDLTIDGLLHLDKIKRKECKGIHTHSWRFLANALTDMGYKPEWAAAYRTGSAEEISR